MNNQQKVINRIQKQKQAIDALTQIAMAQTYNDHLYVQQIAPEYGNDKNIIPHLIGDLVHSRDQVNHQVPPQNQTNRIPPSKQKPTQNKPKQENQQLQPQSSNSKVNKSIPNKINSNQLIQRPTQNKTPQNTTLTPQNTNLQQQQKQPTSIQQNNPSTQQNNQPTTQQTQNNQQTEAQSPQPPQKQSNSTHHFSVQVEPENPINNSQIKQKQLLDNSQQTDENQHQQLLIPHEKPTSDTTNSLHNSSAEPIQHEKITEKSHTAQQTQYDIEQTDLHTKPDTSGIEILNLLCPSQLHHCRCDSHKNCVCGCDRRQFILDDVLPGESFQNINSSNPQFFKAIQPKIEQNYRSTQIVPIEMQIEALVELFPDILGQNCQDVSDNSWEGLIRQSGGIQYGGGQVFSGEGSHNLVQYTRNGGGNCQQSRNAVNNSDKLQNQQIYDKEVHIAKCNKIENANFKQTFQLDGIHIQ